MLRLCYMFGRHLEIAPQSERRKGGLMLLISLLISLVGSLIAPQTASALPTLALPDAGVYNSNLTQIHYNNINFSGPNVVKEGDSLNKQADGFNYDPGTVYFIFTKASDKLETESYIIVVNAKDKPTQGQYSKFIYNTKDKTFSKRSDTKNIRLSEGEIPTVRNCNIPWIGIVVCPLSNALASAIDDLYDAISSALVVTPLDINKEFASGQQKPIYAIWSIVRNISNIVFIALFLVVIASYITGFGLSNYTIKKVFPRLIVTAIVVNLSLTICTLLIDLFNILGYSVADIFIKIQRTTMAESDFNSINAINWTALLATVYGAGGTFIALNGGIIGSALLLLGSMAGALGTILGVVVMLSVRQAMVLILTVCSPLIFVLNLLPNTERWFKKWWGTFIKILAVFPIFSLIYGASQLASSIIIQTANDSFILILVGLIVKVVPFGLLFTIIKWSDSIMDNVTKSVTNRTKSLGEGLEGFFHRKQEIQKTQYESGNLNGARRYFTPRGWGQSMNRARRRDEANLRTAKAQQEAFYAHRSSALDKNQRPANADANAEMSARAAEATANAFKAKLNASFNTLSAKVEADLLIRDDKKKVIGMKNLNSFTNETEYQIASASLVKQIADNNLKATTAMVQEAQGKRIVGNVTLPAELGYEKDTSIRTAISGINNDYNRFLLADVINAQRKEFENEVDLNFSFAKQINLSEADAISYAIGKDILGSGINAELATAPGGKLIKVGKDGESYTITSNDKALRFAMAKLVGQAPRDDIHEFIIEATASLYDGAGRLIKKGDLDDYREEIVDLMLSKVGSNKMLSIKVPDYARRGLLRGRDTFYEVNTENIARGRYSANYLASVSKDFLNTMIEGVEKLINNDEIALANLDQNGRIKRVSLFDNFLEDYKDKATGIIDYEKAKYQIEYYHDAIIDALTDPQTHHLIQEQQKQRLEKLVELTERLLKNDFNDGIVRNNNFARFANADTSKIHKAANNLKNQRISKKTSYKLKP